MESLVGAWNGAKIACEGALLCVYVCALLRVCAFVCMLKQLQVRYKVFCLHNTGHDSQTYKASKTWRWYFERPRLSTLKIRVTILFTTSLVRCQVARYCWLIVIWFDPCSRWTTFVRGSLVYKMPRYVLFDAVSQPLRRLAHVPALTMPALKLINYVA